jgi:hypothetical protein
MKLPPFPLLVLLVLYVVFTALAIGRLITTGAPDMFSLGVIPVLIGLVLRANWGLWALRIYVAIQISPEDAKLFIEGKEIPLPLVAAAIAALLAFQWWVAFHSKTKAYLSQQQ